MPRYERRSARRGLVYSRAMRGATRAIGLVTTFLLLCTAAGPAKDADWTPLFAADGEPKGFRVAAWDDVSKPPPEGAKWVVKDGALTGAGTRGSWLVSEAEYADFELELDFRIGAQGNSGIGLRFPDAGDPAFDGMELQIMGAKYRGDAEVPANERTGAIYQMFEPKAQVYRAGEWNHYAVVLRGPRLTVHLNGHLVQGVNLDEQKEAPKRGKPAAERPRKGHIGFQELSRGDTRVEIKGARVRRL
jgi:hypothetical protein